MVKRLITQVLSIIALLFVLVPSLAIASAVTQGYKTSIEMPNGAVVSLTKDSGDTVEKTTLQNEALLVGVAAAPEDALIDVQPAGSLIRVAVSGDTSLLVSDMDGDINPGDQLAISPLAGIATKMNSNTSTKKIIAAANEKFNKTVSNIKQVEVELVDGTKKTVFVGRITAKLLLNDRSDQKKSSQNQSILATIGEKLTGKPTNPVRLVASSLIAIGTLAIAGLILNSSVKGSFISLGRNPLSKDSIISGILKVSLLGIAILALGFAFAYAVLIV